MFKNIIFDYGNVIFDIEHARTIQAFTDLGVQKEQNFFGHKLQDPLFDLFERGKVDPAHFYNEIRRISGSNLSDEQIKTAWNTLLIGIRDGYLEHLLKLKSNYRTFLLSNNNAIHYEWIIKYLQAKHQIPDMSTYFEKDYYSHLMGMRKPDAEIFEYVLETHKLDPSETLFIDDSPQHLETAKKLGLQTHLMLLNEDLRTLIPF